MLASWSQAAFIVKLPAAKTQTKPKQTERRAYAKCDACLLLPFGSIISSSSRRPESSLTEPAQADADGN